MCGEEGRISLFSGEIDVKVRGESFRVPEQKYHCAACGEAFRTSETKSSLAAAYELYRKAHCLLQPSELLAWRDKLGLKQTELAVLLGWSVATVSRYENGALQDDAHDRALRAAMTLDGLAAVLHAAHGLEEKSREKLRKYLADQAGQGRHLTSAVHENIEALANRRIRWVKVEEAVLYFCNWGAVSRTKLNKLMFYMDFLHLKSSDESVTGLPYLRLQFGPVPVAYELIYSTLARQGILEISEEEQEDYTSYLHKTVRAPQLGVFNPTELACLIFVQKAFAQRTAKWLSEYSHKEAGWIETPTGKEISPAHARTLSLSIPH